MKIKVPAGTYYVSEAEALLDSAWPTATLGLSYEGMGPGISAIRYAPKIPGPLFSNNNGVLFLRISGLMFACEDPSSTFYEGYSKGQAQDVRCSDVLWKGTWAYGFHLTGSNNNSEFKWESCTISGGWNYFLDLAGNDQLLNYWFSNCKFWSTGGWVRARQGGHIKLVSCDVSWIAKPNAPLFALLTTNHFRGVCHFVCIGCRFEIHSDHEPVLHSQWPHGAISFICADFGSQAPWRSAEYIEATVDVGPEGHAMLHWQDCTLIGRHQFRAISDLANRIGLPERGFGVSYTGCSHLSATEPESMVLADDALLKSSVSPKFSFLGCRSEAVRSGMPPVPWVMKSGTTQKISSADRQILRIPIHSRDVTDHVASLPLGALLVSVCLYPLRQVGLRQEGKIDLRRAGPGISPGHGNAKDFRWEALGKGDYIVDIEVRERNRGVMNIRAQGGDVKGAAIIQRNGQFNALVHFPAQGTLYVDNAQEFDGVVRVRVSRAGEEFICGFRANALSSGKPLSINPGYHVKEASYQPLTLAVESLFDPLESSNDGIWAFLVLEYLC
ncbi:hypothetical protein QRQ56_25440 [Bradyrhizobium sp. U531]|uniref:hypothetical protein n=1 Tax=Bradyrhizobium sp. U531 TaxID=3053458 RepID=UPI003F42B5F2